ncbi:MAG: presenilin family intramembrane aspartyl protease [Nitrososphaerota archaeon]
MSDKPVRRVRMLVPIIVSLSMAWLFLALIMLSSVEPLMLLLTPFEEPTNGQDFEVLLRNPMPYLNALVFLGVVFAGSVLVVIFLKLLKKFVRALVTGALWLVAFSVLSFYTLVCLRALLLESNLYNIWLPAVVLMATVTAYISTSKRGLLSLLTCGLISTGAGVALGNSIPFWTAIVLLLAISVYDVLAVLRGHLRILKEHELESLRGLVVKYDDLMIGLGDMFFYAFLTSFATLHMGVLAGIGGTFGMLVGYVLTLKLLERRWMLPGLPIPILIGLVLALLFGYL